MRGEKVYEYEVAITGATDFGVSLEAVLSGQAPMPPLGVRVDFTFEGRSTGRLAGRLWGVDYFRLRPDGRAELDIRGVIETDDGARICLEADGITQPRADGATELFENVRLTTASEAYAWVNTRLFWAEGVSDGARIRISAYMQ